MFWKFLSQSPTIFFEETIYYQIKLSFLAQGVLRKDKVETIFTSEIVQEKTRKNNP